CRRVPLAGELLHELSSHRRVCQLCLAGLPESKRETISSERMHVSSRPLRIAPRAASALPHRASQMIRLPTLPVTAPPSSPASREERYGYIVDLAPRPAGSDLCLQHCRVVSPR